MSFYRFATMEGPDGQQEARLYISGTMMADAPWWSPEDGVTTGSLFRQELLKLEGLPLTVVVDSSGGDLGAGVAIYSMLRERKGITRAEVYKAYSAATLVVAGCDKGERMLSPAATLLYHNPMTYAEGDHREMERTGRFLQAVKQAVIAAYQETSGKTVEELDALMDAETIYTAQEAIDAGFADRILEKPDRSLQGLTAMDVRQVTMQATWGLGRQKELPTPANQGIEPDDKGTRQTGAVCEDRERAAIALYCNEVKERV